MAAKLLHSLADDDPDLQKQIGCMTGVFQLFDRQHVLTGHLISHKRLLPGNSHFNDSSLERETGSENYRQTSMEININKGLNEKQRLSTESSRASFSSSCSSSFSSMECNRAEPEVSFDRIIFPENISRDPVMNMSYVSPHSGRQSPHLRDVVKDSMYREGKGLSVKTIKEEAVSGRIKPLQLSKFVNDSHGADLKESIRVLDKFRDAPWYGDEARELAKSSYDVKDGPWHSLPKDTPRFSYDGRDISRLSFESGGTLKSSPKLKELPRLSLDSRGDSVRSSSSDSKISQLPKNSQSCGNSNDKISNESQLIGAQKRHPGVVAKLMGLEALPDSSMDANNEAGSVGFSSVGPKDSFSRSLRINDLNTCSRNSNPSKFSMKDSTSPRWKNSNLVMRPVSSSRFPIEPAPWKQKDGWIGSQETSLSTERHTTRTANSFPSVYSEIEKTLQDIKFKQSGKVLRALKQILEATQAKGLLDPTKEEQISNFGSEKTYEPCRSSHQNPKSVRPQKPQSNQSFTSTVRGSDTTRVLESQIVIMKPAKRVDKPGRSASSVIPIDDLSGPSKTQSGIYQDNKKALLANSRTARDQSSHQNSRDTATGTNDRKTSTGNLRSTQFHSKSSQLSKGNSHVPVKNSGSGSPRLQRKRLDLEKRSRPPTPPSDSTNPRRLSSKQATELASPGGKRKPKYRNMQHSDDQSRNLSFHGDDTSLLPDHNALSDSNLDEQMPSNLQFSKINGSQIPSLETNCSVSDSMQKNPTQKLDKDGSSVTELATIAPEQPSPVSVLDTSICRDDAPSSAKHIPHAPEDDANIEPRDAHDESHWNTEDKLLSNGVGSTGLTLELNRKKLQDIESLVQKLRRLNSSHDEASTDYIASLCENTNPGRRYISEILLASGLLLRDLGSELMTFQFHSSGHPINPELFFVLEQTKASTLLPKEECTSGFFSHSKSGTGKHHRKLLFDTVNEILGVKLSLATCSETWLKPIKLSRKTLTARKLLKELCSEIEYIQAMKSVSALGDEDNAMKSIFWEDVIHRQDSWTDFHNEMPGLVLDVERLVFKDLVDEIVIGGAPDLLFKPSRRRKLQFAQ